jgi:hypothetical protein
MPQLIRNGGVIAQTKSTNISSFVFDHYSEPEITYENYFDSNRSDDFIEAITTVNYIFEGDKSFKTDIVYNTFFQKLNYDLQHFDNISIKRTNNFISTWSTSQIYSRLASIAEMIGHDNAINEVQQATNSVSTTLKDYAQRQNIVKKMVNNVVYGNNAASTGRVRIHQVLEHSYKNLLEEGYSAGDAAFFLSEKLLFATDIDTFQTSIYNSLYESSGEGTIAAKLNEISQLSTIADYVTMGSLLGISEDPILIQSQLIVDAPTKDTIFSEYQYVSYSPKIELFTLEEHPWYLNTETTKSLQFTKPDDAIIPINYYSQKFVPLQEPKGRFFQTFSMLQEPAGKFFEEINDIIVPTVFTTPLVDFTLNLKPQYVEDGDKTFLHSIQYVEYSIYYAEMLDWQHTIADTSIIPDTQYESITTLQPKTLNSFAMQMLGVRADSKFVIGDYGVYHFITEREDFKVYIHSVPIFFQTNTSHDSVKPHILMYYRAESNHPSTGGGQHSGHNVPMTRNGGSSHYKVMDVHFLKEGQIGQESPSGRHGRSVSTEFRITQIVKGKDDETASLYEFDEVNHNLDENSGTGIGDGIGFNFVYTLAPGATRIPSHLAIDGTFIKGFIGENDTFIRKYSYEGWVEEQGYVVDDDYLDFNPLEKHLFKTTMKGVSATKMNFDVLTTGEEFKIGNKVYQYKADGTTIKAEGTITKKIETFAYPITTAAGIAPTMQNFIRYEVDDVSGIFDVFTVEESFTTVTDTVFDDVSVQAIDEEITALQLLIANSSDPAQIQSLQNTITNLQTERAEIIFDTTSTVISRVATPSNYIINTVTNNVVTMTITAVNEDSPRGLIKIIDLEFPVKNNYSFDRDNFLFNSEMLPKSFIIDGKVLNREEWIAYKRSQGNFRFDTDSNNSAIDTAIESLTTKYNNGSSGLTKEEFDVRIVSLQNAKGDDTENKRSERLEIIDADNFVIDNGEALIPVDEKTFYENPEEISVVSDFTIYR